MPHFMILAHDKPNSLDLRMATRPDHLAYFGAMLDKAIIGGALLDEAGNPKGSMLIMELASLEEAEEIVANDPYNKAGLFQSTSVTPYKIAIDPAAK